MLVASARDAGFAIHGAGPVIAANQNAEWSERHSYIILERGASRDRLGEFLEWLESRRDPQLATVPRIGDEKYLS